MFLAVLLSLNPQYVRYEPQVAVLYATGMLFFAAGIVGSVLYPLVRRRGFCGGDRTQDLNENMRCILQLYTAAYIVVLACILHWYVFLVLASFLFLFLLYTGSFILGMFHYNEDIPPTKRTDASNYAGTAMLVAIVMSFPVCAALMLVTNTIMLLSLSITNFGCRPYENIVLNWPGRTVDVMVLDDVSLSYFFFSSLVK
ncbi:hypothetical protein V5799_006950 [Amblyomma americanum]|uniref:Uncharacterized protein n=1 Tax=Amblyomma americanum TaxID=6943 RepID=A0AAQ4DUX9_AMBAM